MDHPRLAHRQPGDRPHGALLDRRLPPGGRGFRRLYAVVFAVFLLIMVAFIWPTLDKPLTWMALVLCLLLILDAL